VKIPRHAFSLLLSRAQVAHTRPANDNAFVPRFFRRVRGQSGRSFAGVNTAIFAVQLITPMSA
jgi:hypothetical protein